MFKNKSILIFLFLIIPPVVFLFFNRTGEAVICTKVLRGQIEDSVSGNIRILADQTYHLKAKLPGTVKSVAKLPLQKSITVKTGQSIIQLDISDLNRSLEQAIISKINFNKSIQAGSINALELKIEQEEHDAFLKLSEGEHISSINLKKKRTVIDRLKTKVAIENISNEQELLVLNTKIDNLKSQINKMTISSPIDGELIQSLVSPGEFVTEGQLIGTVISKQRVVEASLNEEDFHELKVGMDAAITLFSDGKNIINAKVSRIADSVDSSSGRRLAYLKINSPTVLLPTGASGRVEIIRDKKTDTLLISKNALVGNSVVTVNKNNKTVVKEVKIGAKNLNFVEIVEGLDEGDVVVSETPHFLGNDKFIKPVFLFNNN
jgi:macrolide-specific efflux system membrane fusion protein